MKYKDEFGLFLHKKQKGKPKKKGDIKTVDITKYHKKWKKKNKKS